MMMARSPTCFSLRVKPQSILSCSIVFCGGRYLPCGFQTRLLRGRKAEGHVDRTLENLLKKQFGLDVLKTEKSGVGVGSDTWFVTCSEGKYVVKYHVTNEMNHPEQEPELCEYLMKHGIPVSKFLKNKDGCYLSVDENGRLFHVQQFMEGTTYALNTAPDWLLKELAGMLGRIHTVLKAYDGLPVGLGSNFFRNKSPKKSRVSYQNSLSIAERDGDKSIAQDLAYRIELMDRIPNVSFDLERLTCQSTHGDYSISQMICGERNITAVIDWTTACVHPIVWEIIRSFVYASPSCVCGNIDIDEFVQYVTEYRKYADLSEYDLKYMVPLFNYQIAVSDYYGQYYSSVADNRSIFLHQAQFSTKLLRWFEANADTLSEKLMH